MTRLRGPWGLCAALLVLWGVVAGAQRQGSGAPWQPDLPSTLEVAQERSAVALVVALTPGLPLAALQLEQLAEVSGREGWVFGQADAASQDQLLRSVFGHPAALALLVLSADGEVLAARPGFVSGAEARALMELGARSVPSAGETADARLERARDLQERGLRVRRDALLADLLADDLSPQARAAAQELRVRSHLQAGDVRLACAELELLTPLSSVLPPGDWAFDRAACAYAKRELDVALQSLSRLPVSNLPHVAKLLKARVLHELERDTEATALLDALEHEQLSPSVRLEFVQARLHLQDISHGHSH